MDEAKARALLEGFIQPDDILSSWVEGRHAYNMANGTVEISGQFTPDELEALAWWMRHKIPK